MTPRLASRAAGWDEGEGRESVSTRWTTWGCGVAGAFFLNAGLAAPLVADPAGNTDHQASIKAALRFLTRAGKAVQHRAR